MRRGENPSVVLDSVEGGCRGAQRLGRLPTGVRVDPVLRSPATWSTPRSRRSATASCSASRLVVLVCCCSSAGRRWPRLVAVTIPFSLLFALVLMYLTDIPIGLLSIGAIDFGIIVDGAVIMAENIARRLGDGDAPRAETVHVRRGAARRPWRCERPVFFSVLMIVGRLFAAAVADAHRRAAVPADGADDGLRAGRALALRPVRGAGAGDFFPPAATRNGRTHCCVLRGRYTADACALLLAARWLVVARRAGRLGRVVAAWWCRGWASSSCRTWTKA